MAVSKARRASATRKEKPEADAGSRGKDLAAGETSKHLDASQQRQAAAHAAPQAIVIHEVVREEGESELHRSGSALFWSALAAGLSMGFSLLTLALLQSMLPHKPWAPILAAPGYCVGFIIVIMGRQQLFTESTLTVMLPLFVHRDLKTATAILRLWAIVLGANLLGTIIIARLLSFSTVFDSGMQDAMRSAGIAMVHGESGAAFLKAIFAGWLIALMVWILPSARAARLFVILLLTYVVALGRFPHVVAGSVEAAYAVFAGGATVLDYMHGFLLPTLLGNTLGGVALAALLNHAPLADDFADAPST
jgi:formate/nitrite transporter FocA (FNT family)